MAKQVFDLRDSKGMSYGQSTEHLRNYKVTDPDMKKFGYFDPTRERLNFEVGKGGVITPINKEYSIVQRFKDNLKSRGIEDPNDIKRKKGMKPNRRTVANIIIGGSREQMHKLAFGDQMVDLSRGADNSHIHRHESIEKWAVDMYNYIAKRFGEENIIAFIVHIDEKNPHIHCTLVPVNKKNRISYNDIFGGNKEMSRQKFLMYHNEVAEVNKKWNLERGDDISVTGAKHRTTEEYFRWLRQRCEELEKEEKGRREALQLLEKEILRNTIKSKGLQKMIENLNNSRQYYMDEIAKLKEQMDKGNITNEELEQKKRQLEEDLAKVEEKLQDKSEKLDTANGEMRTLERMKQSLEMQFKELVDVVNREMPAIQEKAFTEMSAVGYDIINETMPVIKERMLSSFEDNPSICEQLNTAFDESGLNLIAEKAEDIVFVATALFVGYLDQATTIAQQQGGGGSSPDSNWGRRPDEDDEEWKRRCFLMAYKMMRPQPKKVNRWHR